MTYFSAIYSLSLSLHVILSACYMDLYLLSESVIGGRCLDDSMAGYYYEAPQYGASGLWVIYLQGGGSCYTKSSCTTRVATSLGSSSSWNAQISGSGIFSVYQSNNPDFYTGHHVAIPYCTGDLYNGRRVKSNDSWPFNFNWDGHLVIDEIINDLINNFNLSLATNVVVTGSSAGGIGTILNIDYIASKLKPINNNIIIKGIALDGWFFAGNTTDQYLIDPLMPPSDYNNFINNQIGGDANTWHINANVDLWNSYLHPMCKQYLGNTDAWHCQSAHVLYTFIITPIFIAQNQFDSNQIHSQFNTPLEVNQDTTNYVKYFGKNMKRSVTQIGNQNGLFLASCYDHGGGIGYGTKSTTIIDGYSATQIMSNWFWERTITSHIVTDTCDINNDYLPCNPTCLDNQTFFNIINMNDTQTMNLTSTEMIDAITTSMIIEDSRTATLNASKATHHFAAVQLFLSFFLTCNL